MSGMGISSATMVISRHTIHKTRSPVEKSGTALLAGEGMGSDTLYES